MDKWKIAVIVALIFGLGAYGYYQANAPEPLPTPPAPDEPDKVKKFKELVGKPAPAWEIEPKLWANAPKPITLSDVKGSVTLLEFWRTGCSHCRAAAPFMQKAIFEKYGPKGLKMVTFHSPAKHPEGSTDPEINWTAVQATMKELGIKYPVAFDTEAKLFREKYHGYSYPSVILLDREGVIRYAMPGHTRQTEASLLVNLHKLLGLAPPDLPKPLLDAASTPAPASPAPAADPHAGHNHPPGEGHGHEGHGHGPGDGHGH